MLLLSSLVKRPLFWGILLPFLLAACGPLLLDFESDFVDSPAVERAYLDVETEDGPIRLSYLRAGSPSGQRVIFVHGTPGDAAGSWLDYLNTVPDGFEFIAVDRPGFGHTTPKKAFVRLKTQADVLRPLLDTPGPGKPVVVGHSLGGPVVAALAAHYPDEVGAVIQLASAMDPDLEEVLWVQYLGKLPPFSWTLPTAAKNSNDELIALEAELRQLLPRLDRIHAPITIIHGTADSLVPYANVAFMRAHFTGAALEFITLEGEEHFLPWRQPEVIRRAILKQAAAIAGYGASAE